MLGCYICVYQRNAARQANVTKYWNPQLSHNDMITTIIIFEGRKHILQILPQNFCVISETYSPNYSFSVPPSEEKQTKHKCRCIRKQCSSEWRVPNKVSTSETRLILEGILQFLFQRGTNMIFTLTSKFLPQIRWKWMWHYGDFYAGESKQWDFKDQLLL